MSERSLVLVVDDEEDIREILGMQIEDLEFEWIGAQNGEEALEILAREPVDVVVSDITMPKMNGIDFLRNSRLNGYDKPFIVLTGNATKNTAMEALRLGAFDFLEKPFEPAHMKSLFADAMRSSKEQQNSSFSNPDSESEESSADSAGEPVQQIRMRFPSEEADTANSWERGNSSEEFIDSFSNQLNFCKASVKGLLKKNQIPIELGYLFRVMRALSTGAKHWGYYDLSTFSYEMTEMLLYFRTNPDYLTHSHIQTISNGLNSLINIFSALNEQNSVMYKSHEIRNLVFQLNMEVNGDFEQETEELKKVS